MKTDQSMDKLLAAIAHLGYFSGVGFFFAPLIIWILKKDESPFLAHHAKQAMVYQGGTFVAMSLLGTGASIFCFLTIGLGALVAVPALILLSLLIIIPSIIATIKAVGDEEYRYPVFGNWAETL